MIKALYYSKKKGEIYIIKSEFIRNKKIFLSNNFVSVLLSDFFRMSSTILLNSERKKNAQYIKSEIVKISKFAPNFSKDMTGG